MAYEFTCLDCEQPARWGSFCDSCRAKPGSGVGKAKFQSTPERRLLPIGDFRIWLSNRVVEIGIGNVAASAGDDPKRVKDLIQGDFKTVTLDVVDRYMSAFGDHYLSLYPETRDW